MIKFDLTVNLDNGDEVEIGGGECASLHDVGQAALNLISNDDEIEPGEVVPASSSRRSYPQPSPPNRSIATATRHGR